MFSKASSAWKLPLGLLVALLMFGLWGCNAQGKASTQPPASPTITPTATATPRPPTPTPTPSPTATPTPVATPTVAYRLSPQGPLPEHAIARVGKGILQDAVWSPSGQRYAVATSLGTYIYERQGTLVTFLPAVARHVRFLNEETLVALTDDALTWWNVAEAQRLREQALPAAATVMDVFPEEGRVAVGLEDGRVLLFAANAEEAPVTLAPVTGAAVTALAYSPQGTVLAVGYANGQAALWPSGGAEAPNRLWDAHNGKVTALAFGTVRLNTLLATGGADSVAYGWDVRTGERLVTYLGRGNPITALAFTWQGDLLIGADAQGGVLFWDAGNGILGQYVATHKGAIRSMQIQPFGLLALTVGADGKLVLFSLAARGPISEDDTYGVPIPAAALLPDGTVLYAQEGGNLVLWNPEQGGVPRNLNGHKATVHAIVVAPDGQMVATTDADGLILIWDPTTWFQVGHRFHQAGVFPMKNLAFGPGNRYLFGAAWVTLYYWDLESQTTYPEIAMPEQPTLIQAMDVDQQNGQVILGLDDGRVLTWTVEDKTFTQVFQVEEQVRDVAFLPQGQGILALTATRLYHWTPGQQEPRGFSLPLSAQVMTLLPDGRVLFGGQGWGVLDPATGQWQLLPPGHGSAQITYIQANREGTRILTLAEDGSLLIWDATQLLP